MSAGGVDISFAKNNSNIKGILWAGYPREEGGHAIADVVFGTHNPGGKLPLTWHENSYVDMLPMTSMQLRPLDIMGYPGRTYRFFNDSIVYPFGYGLSYTNFTYKISSSEQSLSIQLNKFQHCRDLNYTDGSFKPPCPAVLIDDLQQCDDQNVKFEVEVQNIGQKDGRETVILYYLPPAGIQGAPIKQVIAFDKVFLAAGESQKVPFKLNACKSLGVVSFNGYTLLPAGSGTIVIGDDLLSFPISVNFQQ
ncbi:unnamed protein product [Fraxinus pennsylvanica]|uniref:Fibronectin type III-like domain-containing protein n=1 Tax=Fraxinus pennsylvanica TaxID=56036 RepID=A0AAD2EH72_9LAMI|nr:unnamed protein product [Fraxinus pennsylvanica]